MSKIEHMKQCADRCAELLRQLQVATDRVAAIRVELNAEYGKLTPAINAATLELVSDIVATMSDP